MLDNLSSDINPDIIYVTLYGVESGIQIGEQLYQQMHPFLAHKSTRLVGAVMRGFVKGAFKFDLDELHKESLNISGQIPNLGMNDILNGANQRIIVFDDFERAVMSPVELLGYINPLVEHDNCKVIIISNESALSSLAEDYRIRKEKTVGQTYKVKADIKSAFPRFVEDILSEHAKKFLIDNSDIIEDIFINSEYQNLRIVKQFLWSFERLYIVFTEEQRRRVSAMRELLGYSYALTILFKSGDINPDEYRNPDVTFFMRYRNEPDNKLLKALDAAFKKFSSVDFNSNILSYDTLRQILLMSYVDQNKIQIELENHPYFAKPADLPSWRALWFSDKLSSEEAETVEKRFSEDFENRTFRKRGEILHIAGLCLWLADIDQLGWDTSNIVDRVKIYISDIYDNFVASFQDLSKPVNQFLSQDSAYQLGFRNQSDNRFNEISLYLFSRIKLWRERAYPEAASILLTMLSENAEGFTNLICRTAQGVGQFCEIPILTHIAVDRFVTEYYMLSSSDRRQVLVGLVIRYESITPEGSLKDEVSWFLTIYHRLIEQANIMKPIKRFDNREQISSFLDKTIDQLINMFFIDLESTNTINQQVK